MTISSSATDIRSRFPQGKVGKAAYVDSNDITRTLINSDPQAVQVTTYTVDSASNSTTYTLTVDGFTASYTSDASATTAEIAAGIKAAIDANPSITGRLTASVLSNVVTLTGNYPGISFTASDSSGDTTIATTTAAATADAVGFGRLMVTGGYQTDEANELGKLCKAAALTAQVDSYLITYDASVLINVTITVDGLTYQASYTMATDLDTSLDALVVLINGATMGLPANTVIATATPATATTLVLTSEVAGKPFTSSVTFGAGADTAAAVLTQTAPVSSDINRAARGVSMFAYDAEIPTIAGTEATYAANSGVTVMQKGSIWVASSQSPTHLGAVYVETGVTADNGKFFTTSSSTRLLLSGAKWERDERSTQTDNIAVLRVSF